MIRTYDRLAARYDKMHDRWLRHAGGEAQAALEASLISRIQPNDRVLDAGCGTGALSRAVASQIDDVSLTLFDQCDDMLALTGDVKAYRVRGSLLDTPFEDGAFDVAVAAWSIEATGHPDRAIAELIRVVRPGGRVLVAFCADEPPVTVAAALLRKGVEFRQTGSFLDAQHVEAEFRRNGATEIIRHRCSGPVAVLDARVSEWVPLELAA